MFLAAIMTICLSSQDGDKACNVMHTEMNSLADTLVVCEIQAQQVLNSVQGTVFKDYPSLLVPIAHSKCVDSQEKLNSAVSEEVKSLKSQGYKVTSRGF